MAPFERTIGLKVRRRAMKKKQEPSSTRNNVEAQADKPINNAYSSSTMRDESVLALVHELQVHQAELNVQKEELKRSQAELEELTSKYRDLYESAPIGYMTLDSRGRIQEANLACAAMLGVGRNELIHRHFPPFLLPGSLDAFSALSSLTQRVGTHQSYELDLRRADGAALFVQAEVVSVGVDGAGENQLRVALLDITARKQAEQAVQEHFDVLARKLGFLTGELDLERFLKQTLVVLTEQDHAECAAFWFTDTKQETISLHSVNDGCKVMAGSQSGHPYASVPLPLQSLAFWKEMRRSRRPLILHEFETYPQFPMLHERGDLEPRARTLLFVPLLLGQEILGLAVLQSLDRRIYLPGRNRVCTGCSAGGDYRGTNGAFERTIAAYGGAPGAQSNGSGDPRHPCAGVYGDTHAVGGGRGRNDGCTRTGPAAP